MPSILDQPPPHAPRPSAEGAEDSPPPPPPSRTPAGFAVVRPRPPPPPSASEDAPDGGPNLAELRAELARLRRGVTLMQRHMQRSAKLLESQARQTELLRTKLFTLHAALIAGGVVPIAEPRSPWAEVAPLERVFAGHDRLVIVFGGMAGRPMMPPAEFARSLSGRGADLLFVKDFWQAWYQRGLLGISRGVKDSVEALRRSAAEGRYREVHMVGMSAGGFAALLFGALLPAKHIVAFSPQTLISAATIEEFAATDTRAEEIPQNGQFTDLARILPTIPFSGTMDVYFAAHHRTDAPAAQRLTGTPGVRLHPLPTDMHNVVRFLRDQGRFDETLPFLPPPG